MFDFLTQYYGLGSELLAWVLGIIFVVHGWPKLKNPAMVAGVWGGSRIAGLVHGAVEVLAGIAVALNFYGDLGLVVMAIIMLGALFFKITKWRAPFAGKNTTGWEFDLILFAAAVALLLG